MKICKRKLFFTISIIVIFSFLLLGCDYESNKLSQDIKSSEVSNGNDLISSIASSIKKSDSIIEKGALTKGRIDTDGKYFYFIANKDDIYGYNSIYKIPFDKLDNEPTKVMGENTSIFDNAELVYGTGEAEEHRNIRDIYCYNNKVYFLEAELINDKYEFTLYCLKKNKEKEAITVIPDVFKGGALTLSIGFHEEYLYLYNPDKNYISLSDESITETLPNNGIARVNLKTGKYEVLSNDIGFLNAYIDDGNLYYMSCIGHEYPDETRYFKRINLETLQIETILEYDKINNYYDHTEPVNPYVYAVKDGIAFISYSNRKGSIYVYNIDTGEEEEFFSIRGETTILDSSIDVTDDTVYVMIYVDIFNLDETEVLYGNAVLYEIPIDKRNITDYEAEYTIFKNLEPLEELNPIKYFNIINDKYLVIENDTIKLGSVSLEDIEFTNEDDDYKKALSVYRDIVSSYYPDNNEAGFLLGHIDNDEIPELFLFDGMYNASPVIIYTFYDGAVTRLEECGSNATISFKENKNLILSEYAGQGNYYSTFYKIIDCQLVQQYELLKSEVWDNEAGEIVFKYYLNNEEITESVYNSYINKDSEKFTTYSLYDSYEITSSNIEKVLK